MRRFFLFILPAVFSYSILAANVAEDPLDRQMLEIAKELRCAVCQNQPISESNADLAKDMRAIIRQKLQEGKSKQEIKQYFVARYGDYVLLKPPFSASGITLWLLPPLLLILVGGFGWAYVRNRMRSTLPPVSDLSDEDIARVHAARRDAGDSDDQSDNQTRQIE